MQELLRAVPPQAPEPAVTAPATPAEPVQPAPAPVQPEPAATAPEPEPAQAAPVTPPEPAAAPRLNVPKIQPESLKVPLRRSTPPEPSPSPEAAPMPAEPEPEVLETAPAAARDQTLMAPVDDEPQMPDGDAFSSPDGLPADQLGH